MIYSYSTVKRYLNTFGYQRKRSRNNRKKGYQLSLAIKEKFEQRSYEHPYVGSLFHLDFHHCSREIITESGEIIYPVLFCAIDDCSRLVCHAQWYLSESAENLVHGLIQALQKRGLPRSLMSDNGKAMLSNEFTSGLMSLSITHETTLPYSPEQNGKQEVFWSQVEGRMMSMIENKKVVTLKELNHMTQAWYEMEYNRKIHSETKSTPLSRYLSFKSVLRDCPDSQDLRKRFRRIEKRKTRRTDGTISLEGKRFEIPQRYRHMESMTVQFSLWDLSDVDIICKETGKILCQIGPLNKQKNSTGERRIIETSTSIIPEDEVAPIMQDLLRKYSETGLPPAYQPKDEL
jgi:putative transposase